MYDDDRYALTDDERAAGLGDLLHGNYDSPSYKKTYRRKYKSQLFPKNHGKKWTDSEIEEVNDLFISGNSVSDIALLQDRSNYSIAWRLYDSNLITFAQREALKSGAGGVYYKSTRPSKKTAPSAVETSTVKVANKTSELKDINQKPKIEEEPYFLNVINTHTKFFWSIWFFLSICLMIFILNVVVK